ncbi:MAG: hypothetical protein MJ106_07805 [Lentisphaeria bacterium]|nr:hypothetical protein [Lentisphaeria bacterium]
MTCVHSEQTPFRINESASVKTLFIAHRGESIDAPENTCASYRLAMMRSADGYELDIMPTSDDVLICCHHATTKYTCGGVDKLIEETTYADLRQLNACNNHPFYSGEPIPKFADALKVLLSGRKIFVEFKTSDPKWIAPMMAELQEVGLGKEQIVVISFFSEIFFFFMIPHAP